MCKRNYSGNKFYFHKKCFSLFSTLAPASCSLRQVLKQNFKNKVCQMLLMFDCRIDFLFKKCCKLHRTLLNLAFCIFFVSTLMPIVKYLHNSQIRVLTFIESLPTVEWIAISVNYKYPRFILKLPTNYFDEEVMA